jgi:hypothetical protein
LPENKIKIINKVVIHVCIYNYTKHIKQTFEFIIIFKIVIQKQKHTSTEKMHMINITGIILIYLLTKNYNFTFLYVSETNSNLDINNHNTDSRDVIASVWLRLSLSPKTTSGSSSFWLGNDRSLQQGQHLLQNNTHRYTATHVQLEPIFTHTADQFSPNMSISDSAGLKSHQIPLVYHGENRLIFNEMIMRPTLY